MVHSPVKETAVNVDVAVRELPHANINQMTSGEITQRLFIQSPTGRIALRGAQFKRQSVMFDTNARGCAVYTSINIDKKASQLHARRTVYEHRQVSPGNAIGLASSTTMEFVDQSEQE
ncbi:hypothetical protein OROMI_008344 [Orobanche minor]